MRRKNEQFESYLREFQPRQPRALPSQTESAPELWRRLAAAAVVTIAVGTSLWFAKRPSDRPKLEIVTKSKLAPQANTAHVSLSLLPLTQLAVTDPALLDSRLAAASRRVLPDFRSEESTLRVLSKE